MKSGTIVDTSVQLESHNQTPFNNYITTYTINYKKIKLLKF